MKRESIIVPPKWKESRPLVLERPKRRLPESMNQENEPPRPKPVAAFKFQAHPQLEVEFPFTPYECQKAFIAQLADALINRQNALLESPTGTGKTMCLLSTVLSFQYHCQHGVLGGFRKTEDQAPSTKTRERPPPKPRKVDDHVEDLMNELEKQCGELRSLGGDDEGGGFLGETDVEVVREQQEEEDEPATKGRSRGRPTPQRYPRIWYASRTHAQLKQVVAELKRTSYYSSAMSEDDVFAIRLIILGSRDHYCVNPDLEETKGTQLEFQCKKKSANRTCIWHNGCSSHLDKQDIFAKEAYDMEELKALAAKGAQPIRPFCPFYASREAQAEASFILLPYNYLVNRAIRERLKIDVTGDIVVIDEGHNIESTAEDENSFQFSQQDLLSLVLAFEEAATLDGPTGSNESAQQHLTAEDIIWLLDEGKPVITRLADRLAAQELAQIPLTGRIVSEHCKVWTLVEFRKLLDEVGLNEATCTRLSELLRKLQLTLEYVEHQNQDATSFNTHSYLGWAWTAGSLSSYLMAFWDELVSHSIERYRVALFVNTNKRVSVSTAAETTSTTRQLCFWSFAAHVGLDALLNDCHSLVITSGTLKPLDAISIQLGNGKHSFPKLLENGHVITDEQLYTTIVGKSLTDTPLSFTFENLRQNPKIADEVGLILLDIVQMAPKDGHLVFFSSYAQLNSFVDSWTRSHLWHQLQKKINVFREPRTATEAAQEIELYCQVVDAANGIAASVSRQKTNKRRRGGALGVSGVRGPSAASYFNSKLGGLFLGVCRGRLSEGLNLSDHKVRSVVVIGIPYPNLSDVRVSTKRSILDRHPYRKDAAFINGQNWYMRQASQAVNQAIGRVIRHKDDYGAIVLIDARYAEKINELSSWVASNMVRMQRNVPRTWKEVQPELNSFYASRGKPAKSAKRPTEPVAEAAPKQRAETRTEQRPPRANVVRHRDQLPKPKAKRPGGQSSNLTLADLFNPRPKATPKAAQLARVIGGGGRREPTNLDLGDIEELDFSSGAEEPKRDERFRLSCLRANNLAADSLFKDLS